MKKYILSILLLTSFAAFSQTTEKRLGLYANGTSGKVYTDTVYNLPRIPLVYFDGYGNFVNISDIVRSLFSVTGQNYLSYTAGVFTASAVNLSGTNVTGNLPVTKLNGGTSASSTTFWRGDGTWSTPAGGGGSGWNLTGNSGTDTLSNFIGTTDNQNLLFKVKDVFSGLIDTSFRQRTYFGFGAGNYLNTKLLIGNTAFGYKALGVNQGQYNTAIGTNAAGGLNNSLGSYNTVMGYNAMKNATAVSQNTIIGYNSSGALTGSLNTIIGSGTCVSCTSISESTILGIGAVGTGTATASRVVAIGESSLGSLTSGGSNVAVGYASMYATTTGTQNIAIGNVSGRYNTTGSSQIFLNSYDRGSYSSEQTISPFYAQQTTSTTIATDQRVTLNGRVGINTITPDSSANLDLNGLLGKGFLNSRMTTTKRDSISSSILKTTFNNIGSGYTNGTYTNVNATGGSGTGAVFSTVIVSGGVITSAGISTTKSGIGYKNGDVISALSADIGGTGTGFAMNVTWVSQAAKGLAIYDSTVNQTSTYNGKNWSGYIESSAGTLTLVHGTDYVFTGTTTTWTLPAVDATIVGRQNAIWIKNRGTGSITLNSNAGSTIYTSSAQSTLTIAAGDGIVLLPGTTYFNVMFNNAIL